MDPVKIAENSVDLNLKLMKWRLELQLDKIIAARLRDLGLCSVQGPPGRTITLVDNGMVSCSNSVRQSLFTFTDCQEGSETQGRGSCGSSEGEACYQRRSGF